MWPGGFLAASRRSFLPTCLPEECKVCRSDAYPADRGLAGPVANVRCFHDNKTDLLWDINLETVPWSKLCRWRWFMVHSGWRPDFFYGTCSLLCNLHVRAAQPWWTEEALRFPSNMPLPAHPDSFINPDMELPHRTGREALSHTYQPENDPALRR